MTVRLPAELSLYIHVPFCASRCGYCDFYSRVTVDVARRRYLVALSEQLTYLAPLLSFTTIKTIYFGGGTPSLFGAGLAPIFEQLQCDFSLAPEAEITLEANPDSLTVETLEALMPLGLSRVSIGVQSFDDALLQHLGRRHNADQARAAIRCAAVQGLDVSVDLMCALPGLDEALWERTLQEAASLPVDHVSIYPLSIEPGTDFFLQWQRGELLETDDDEAADQLEEAQSVLEQSGFTRYEISNYARPSKEARHNCSYWTGTPYLGLGPSAASMLPCKNGGRERFVLHETLEDYCVHPARALDATDRAFAEILSKEERQREDLMLSMRLTSGASLLAVQEAGEWNIFEGIVRDGLATYDSTTKRYHPTQRGWLLANEVFRRIL